MTNIIKSLVLEEDTILRAEEYKHERDRIITDILKTNSFTIKEFNGPYDVVMAIKENKIFFKIAKGRDEKHFHIKMSGLRRTIKDYEIICESYLEVVKNSDPRKIEAIDMGRRGLHNEGAQILLDLIEEECELDFETARNFFSIIQKLYKK